MTDALEPKSEARRRIEQTIEAAAAAVPFASGAVLVAVGGAVAFGM